IGSMADLDAANIEWIREFHSDYYRPNNAVLAISGDLEPTQTLRWVEEYFGQAQAREVPAYHPPATVVPGAEREAIVEDANAQTPGLYLGWIIPPFRTKAHYALELVAVLLTYGDSSVLHQSLVREQGELQGIGAWTYD